MANYHIREKTGNINICRAKPGKCPLKDAEGNQPPHFENKEDAQSFIEQELKTQYGLTNALEKNKTQLKDTDPKNESSNRPQDIKVATYTPNIHSFLDISTVSDYDYDFIDYYSNNIDERSFVINSIDEQAFAEMAMNVDRKTNLNTEERNQNINEVKEILNNIGAFDPDNYIVSIEKGYYDGDSPETTISAKNIEKMQQDFENEYFKKDNAYDYSGVLEYVRSKGQETSGLKPIDAIKKQLQNENIGKTSSVVERSTKVISKKLKLDEINIGAKKHYENVEPRETISENTSDEIAGVVYYDKTNKSYRLIDGYHRMKNLKNKNRKTGKYIVLS